MSNGSAQEMRLVSYLKTQGFSDVIHGEAAIKTELGLPLGPSVKCADVVAFSPNKLHCRRCSVAESKGTSVADSLKQLGNAAAGVLEHFGTNLELRLLVYRSTLKELDVGLSPGPGYLVKPTASPNVFQLQDATTSVSSLARASCELGVPWNRWNSLLRVLTVEVYVETLS